MQLIRDNLTLWTSEMNDEAEDGGDGTNVENLWEKEWNALIHNN